MTADQVFGFERVTQRVVDRGLMTDSDAERWLRHLSTGTLFASVTLFMVVALKGRGTDRLGDRRDVPRR